MRRLSAFSEDQQRGLLIFASLCAIVFFGLAATGIYQFFTHESSRSWLGYDPVTGFRQNGTPSEGGAGIHGLFADASVLLTLAGTAWLAYKILFRVPLLGVFAFVLAISGLFTGSLLRFNLVKLEGKSFEEAGTGYAQVFGGDLEYVVTDSYDLGPLAVRLLSVFHVLTLPVMVGAMWLAFTRGGTAPLRRPRRANPVHSHN